jgi:hypothetical protein
MKSNFIKFIAKKPKTIASGIGLPIALGQLEVYRIQGGK